MPAAYTAEQADKAVRLFFDDLHPGDCRVDLWPLDHWVQEGPNRFVHREDGAPDAAVDCTVMFDDDYNAYVHMVDVGSDDVCIKEVE